MKGLFTCATIAIVMALTATADAGPKWADKRADVELRMQTRDFTCSTGSPTTLLVGAAAIGLVLRRRR